MNTPRFSRWAGFLSVAALAGAVWWAQIGLGRERGENLQLREAVGEAQAQQEQQEQITQLRAQAALLETLRAESREAARLRGGLAQLRSEAAERQRLQTENQRLEAQGTNKVGLWARLAAQPGFVPAASFAEAGLATAEGALRSWFNALHQNDFRRAAECMVPKAAAAMAGEIKAMEENARAGRSVADQPFAHLPGYRLVSLTPEGDNVMNASVEFSSEGPMPLLLERIGQEWKVNPEPPRKGKP